MSEKYALKASQSFTVDEVNALDAIFSTLLRGGDAKVLIRSKAASTLPRKIIAMRNSLMRQAAMQGQTLKEASYVREVGQPTEE